MRRRAIRFLIGTMIVVVAATAPSAVQAKEFADWGQAEKVPNVNA